MLILAIDSSQKTQSASIFDDTSSELIASVWQENKSSQFMPVLVKMFEEHNLQAKDIGLLATSIGPGSFTGIRTALSIVKTLAAELDIAVFAVNNFELIRFINGLSNEDAIAIPAGKNDYFISRDSNYANLETNYFSLELDGHKLYEFEEKNLSKHIIEYFVAKRDELSFVDHDNLKPFYLREPSIGVKHKVGV